MKKIRATRKFVRDHKVAIAVAATTIILVKWHVGVIEDHNDFLKEHNLFDVYYHAEV